MAAMLSCGAVRSRVSWSEYSFWEQKPYFFKFREWRDFLTILNLFRIYCGSFQQNRYVRMRSSCEMSRKRPGSYSIVLCSLILSTVQAQAGVPGLTNKTGLNLLRTFAYKCCDLQRYEPSSSTTRSQALVIKAPLRRVEHYWKGVKTIFWLPCRL